MGLLKVQNSPGDGVFEDVKILRFKCGSTLTKETMDLVLSTYPNHSKPYLQVFRTYKESCDKRNKDAIERLSLFCHLGDTKNHAKHGG